MGHPQQPTPTQTENYTEYGVVNKNIHPKSTKSMDTRFNWLRDKECQKQFQINWRHSTQNLGDYWENHHSGKHHQKYCP